MISRFQGTKYRATKLFERSGADFENSSCPPKVRDFKATGGRMKQDVMYFIVSDNRVCPPEMKPR